MAFDPGLYSLTAHRGLFDNGAGLPENSQAAFGRAIEAGYAIELDVRMTADRQLVVFHDATTLRMCGAKLRLTRAALPELGNLRLLDSDQRIPRLQEVLEQVDGRVPLLIELKGRGGTGGVEAQLMRTLEGYTGPWAMESFNPLTLLWFQRNAPHIPRGLLGDDHFRQPVRYLGGLLGFSVRGRGSEARPLAWTMTPRVFARMNGGGRVSRPALLNARIEADFVAYDIDMLQPAEAERFRQAGLHLLVWTVRTPRQLDKARKARAGIIFENQSDVLEL